MTRIIVDADRVYAYVRDRTPVNATSDMQGIGLEKDGKLIAGVLYEGYSGTNVWMHVAAEPGGRWMTRDFLQVCFNYPFVTLGCKRVSGYVMASNAEARRFDEHLGFEVEATLKGAAPDGGDVLLYVMWKEGCRYVDPK